MSEREESVRGRQRGRVRGKEVVREKKVKRERGCAAGGRRIKRQS